MREWPYAKEPFDLKLFVLLFLKKLWIVICAMIVGTVLIGGGYYLKKVVFGGPTEYEITTTYYVEYNSVDEKTGEIFSYTNSATWGSLVVTDWFVDRAWEYALEAGMVPEKYGVEKGNLKNFFSATLPSDVRIPTSTVTTPDKELTELFNISLQKAFIDFGQEQREMDEIRILDTAPLKVADQNVRVLNACILGALTGLFVAAFGLIFSIIWNDAIVIPDTFTYRYGLPMVGYIDKKQEILEREVLENMEYLFRGKENGIVLSLGKNLKTDVVLSLLSPTGFKELIVVGTLDKTDYEKLRLAEGVLLAVEAGTCNSKEIEHVLHELQLQDINALCAVLCNADGKLIKAYRFGRGRK